ncbi:MAG TPA: spermidine/putrescine ABC transporter permease PotB, partial [Candidatus Competibacteraceae bacterium]|nr:spermidine/putrescine ABC transporter permease PotB [Candidatus Competibacteraceae bacterium]
MKTNGLFKPVAVGTIWLWLLLFALIPNLMVIAASLMQRGETDFVNLAFSLESYQRLLDPLYLKVVGSSLYLAAITTLLCLLVGFPFAWLLASSSIRWRPLLLLLVIIPFWTSSLVRTYATVIILRTNGVLNEVLLGLGLIAEPLELLYTPIAVLFGLTYALLPFMVLPLYAALEKLDPRLFEAARDLGAGRLRIFTEIVLPLTLPGIIAGSMLVFLPALGMFYIPDMLGGAKNLLVGNLIQDQFLSARNWPLGSAASV